MTSFSSLPRVAGWLVTIVVMIPIAMTGMAMVGQATAQNSTSASSSKSGADSVKAATKPLTPRSAMPAAHKGSAALPKRGTNNTNAELTQLERGHGAAVPKDSATAKVAPYKSARSSASGPKIDYKYEKPAGGKGTANTIH